MITVQTIRRQPAAVFTGLVVLAGVVVLGIEPATWLRMTWANSAFDSAGGHFCIIVVGLFAWSVSSRVVGTPSPAVLWPHLAAVVSLRFAGELLAIPLLSALALGVVVYCVARLARLGHRRRAVSPFWMAVLFGLTLPVEYFVQRLFGYGLQLLATDGACSLLKVGYSELQCGAVDLTLLGRRVFVDSPCSGARGLLLFFILFAGLAALLRPTFRQTALGVGATALAAFVVNALRIAVLTAGLAHEPALGFDVMDQPWHMLIGLGCLPFGFIPVSMWAYHVSRSSEAGRPEPEGGSEPGGDRAAPGRPALHLAAALVFLGISVAVPAVPSRPVDVVDSQRSVDLPDRLDVHRKQPRRLRPVAREHFVRHGGGAAKADYGAQTLLVVETATPVRHLHAPDEWLGDVGYDVEKVGRTRGPLPAARYRLEAPNGRRSLVDVTFLSSRGRVATSVSEALWYWLSSPGSTWRVIHRIRPPQSPPGDVAGFDREVARLFDVSTGATGRAPSVGNRHVSSSSSHSTRYERSKR